MCFCGFFWIFPRLSDPGRDLYYNYQKTTRNLCVCDVIMKMVYWTKRQHLSPVFSLLIECLATNPRYATERPNELTHKFTDLNSFYCKNAVKVHRGKWSCVQVRFRTFFILVIRIKMRVWVLFRLQIESPIRSEKDHFSQYVHWMKCLSYEFLTKKFFSKSWASKLGVRLICECGSYGGVYGSYCCICFLV